MTEGIIVALITGGVTLAEVQEHNNFDRRVPILEEQMGHVCDDIWELQGLHKRE